MTAFQQVLMFDGDCVMCNSTVHFVANRDRAGAIRFASLQSRFADSVVAEHGAVVSARSEHSGVV
jgi:predicted DCC family thiol-disulfide oxidoreductase YuxK